MYKSIVVGTDGSETAAVAVKQAIQLAKVLGSELHLVSAFQSVPAMAMIAPDVMAQLGTSSAKWESEIANEAESQLKRIADDAKAEGVTAHVHALDGDPSEVLIGVAEKNNADLIVVGGRGMSGAGRFLLGSVPNKVSHHAPCNVLIVHTD